MARGSGKRSPSLGAGVSKPLDGGEALIRAASDLGADYIFSSSGSELAPVWEAYARRAEAGDESAPPFVDATHETTAVGMATGYAAVTGRPQVVLLHAAAGLLQGANAIHGALLTGAPIVVCSGESTGYGDAAGPDPGSQWYRNLSIVGGPQSVAAPFTKWSNEAADVNVLYSMVKRAGEIAAQPPSGPVYVNTPVEVLLAQWEPKATGPAPKPGKTVAAAEDIETAARLLADAKNPVLATETAGRDPEAFAALVELAELLAIPVVEPQSALCANFPRTSPLHAGGELAKLAKDSDLVVLLGCRAPWYPPSDKPGDATVLVVDETPHRPHIAYQVLTADHYVTGDMAHTLRAITAKVRELGADEASVAARRERLTTAHAKSEQSRVTAEREALASTEGPADPVAAAAALREAIGQDSVVIDETITHSRLIAKHLMAESAGRYRYVQGGLGQGLGVALGTKLALKEKLVAFTVGDGSWLYNPVLPGLMASAQYGLPVLIMVFNNGKYLSMRHNHRRVYPDSVAARTGYQLGVDLSHQPDVAAVAAAREIAPALEKAVATVRGGHSSVVNVILSR
jgi:acetolactate synthase-1/2/3 large subunit